MSRVPKQLKGNPNSRRGAPFTKPLPESAYDTGNAGLAVARLALTRQWATPPNAFEFLPETVEVPRRCDAVVCELDDSLLLVPKWDGQTFEQLNNRFSGRRYGLAPQIALDRRRQQHDPVLARLFALVIEYVLCRPR